MRVIERADVYVSAEERELATRALPGLFAKFAIPGVIGLLFIGIQSIIDGVIVGHYVGAHALASINLVLPCYSFMAAIAIVMGIGCQTMIGICLGQADRRGANDAFTTALVFLLGFSSLVSVAVYTFAEDIAYLLGANEVLQGMAVSYIHAFIPFFPALSMMFLGDYVLKATGNPLFSMVILTSMVLMNVGLDLLFIAVLEWGVTGAGIATGIAFIFGASCSMWRLTRPNSLLPVSKGQFRYKLVWQMFYNGSSEGMSELSAGISVFLFNLTMMHYLGENGVAAFTATNYVLFIGTTIFLGISDGVIPIMSYNFGAKQYERVRLTLRMAVKINMTIGILICLGMIIGGEKLISLFFRNEDAEVMRIAAYGTSVYAFAFLMNGLNILSSSYFTSMGNAKISIIISLLRGLIFVVAGIILLPRFIGIEGIWFAIPLAELCTLVISFLLVRGSLKKLGVGRI